MTRNALYCWLVVSIVLSVSGCTANRSCATCAVHQAIQSESHNSSEGNQAHSANKAAASAGGQTLREPTRIDEGDIQASAAESTAATMARNQQRLDELNQAIIERQQRILELANDDERKDQVHEWRMDQQLRHYEQSKEGLGKSRQSHFIIREIDAPEQAKDPELEGDTDAATGSRM